MQPLANPHWKRICLAACLGVFTAACADTSSEFSDLEIERRIGARSSRLYISPDVSISQEAPWRLHGEIETWTFPKTAADPLGPWKYVGPKARFIAEGALVIDKVGQEALEKLLKEGRAQPRLSIQMDERTSEFDTIEVELLVRQSCTAEVVLRFKNGQQITREFKVPGAPQMQTATFPIGWLERSWDGLIELEIRPDTDRPQEVQVRTVRILRNGFALGPEATESLTYGLCGFGDQDSPEEPRVLVVEDIGLVGPGRDLVRGHPQWEGKSLTTAITSFGRTRVSASVIPGWQAHREKGMWHAAILSIAESGEREVLAQLDVNLDLEQGLPKWRSLECEIPANKQQLQTLHLFAWSGDGEVPPFEEMEMQTTSESPRCAAIWGAPFQVDSGATRDRPNIVLVTLDTTRADLAYDPTTAPFLAKLRKEGTSFERAWSAANTTGPSHASLFTGLPVHEHGAYTNGIYPLNRELVTLAESLRSAGYRTIAATNVEHLGSRFQFGQGFDVYLDPPPSDVQVDGAKTLTALEPWLDQLQGNGGGPPFFLWVHLFDAHVPYRVPAHFATELDARGLGLPIQTVAQADLPHLRQTPRHLSWLPEEVKSTAHLAALYRQGVAYADHLTEELYKSLESRELMQNTVFTVTSDHGESLGEQNFWATHASIYPSVQRVPLILHGPGIPHHVEAIANVSSLDVAHTLANLVGLYEDVEWTTLDLLDAANFSGAAAHNREIWFESQTLAQIGRIQGSSLFITNIADVHMGLREATPAEREARPFTHYSTVYREGEFELYDLTADPELANDLRKSKPELAEALDKRARAILKAGLERRAGADESGLTPRERERLSALGYTDL